MKSPCTVFCALPWLSDLYWVIIHTGDLAVNRFSRPRVMQSAPIDRAGQTRRNSLMAEDAIWDLRIWWQWNTQIPRACSVTDDLIQWELSMCPAHCNLILTSLSVKLLCTPVSSFNSTILRLSALVTLAMFRTQLFSHTCSLCCSSVIAKVFVPYRHAGVTQVLMTLPLSLFIMFMLCFGKFIDSKQCSAQDWKRAWCWLRKRALLFAKLHFKGTFARGIIFWGHIAQILGNTSYIWNVRKGASQVLRNICVCKVDTRTSSPLTFDYSCIFITIVSQWITLKLECPQKRYDFWLVICFQIIIFFFFSSGFSRHLGSPLWLSIVSFQ